MIEAANIARRYSRALLFAALALLGALAHAQGGPPLQTDDTGTPGNNNWEINVGLTTDRRSTDREFEAPLLDINYGIGERLQLKFEIPWLVKGNDAERTRSGLGNSLIGMRWRFYENKKHDFALSTYPQFEFNNPNNSVERDIAERGRKLLIPLEITKRVGPVNVNGEIGYRFTQFGPYEWLGGIAVGRQVNKRLELLAEVYSIGPVGGARNHTFDGGGRYKIGGPLVLLFMAGRSFLGPESGEPQLIGYFGVQFQINSHGADTEPSKGLARMNSPR